MINYQCLSTESLSIVTNPLTCVFTYQSILSLIKLMFTRFNRITTQAKTPEDKWRRFIESSIILLIHNPPFEIFVNLFKAAIIYTISRSFVPFLYRHIINMCICCSTSKIYQFHLPMPYDALYLHTTYMHYKKLKHYTK